MQKQYRPKRNARRLSGFRVAALVTLALVVVAAIVYFVVRPGENIPRRDAQANQQPTSSQQEATNQKTTENPNAALQSLVDDIVRAKGDYAIAVVEPGGRSASANGDKQYTAASTYKLFIAYGVFKRINSGSMSWSDPIFGSYDAEECFEQMIVQSNNDCTYAFGDKVGWQAIDDMMSNLGLTNTQVKWHDNITTANDLALYLTKLQNGSLLKDSDKQKLTGFMERQVYRQGIPAGTGVKVADKPGFLDDLLHDAGIVYGPKGQYILVVMSNGSTWGQLADAAKQIHNFLSQ